MSIFITSPEQRIRIYEIAAEMKNAKLSANFISECVEQALEHEGTHDLMVLWAESNSKSDKEEILADLQGEIDMRAEVPKKSIK